MRQVNLREGWKVNVGQGMSGEGSDKQNREPEQCPPQSNAEHSNNTMGTDCASPLGKYSNCLSIQHKYCTSIDTGTKDRYD